MVAKLVVVVGKIDHILGQSAESIRKAKTPAAPTDIVQLESVNASLLSSLDDDGTLYLDAHGAAMDVAGVSSAAVYFGSYTPESLAKMLIGKGLKAQFTGKIYLNGCNTATETSNSYISRFQNTLGIFRVFCSVKGNAGVSQVDSTGKTLVRPNTREASQQAEELKKKVAHMAGLKNEIDRLGEQKDSEVAKDISSEATRNVLNLLSQRLIEVKALHAEITSLHGMTYSSDKVLRPTLPPLAGVTHYQSSVDRYEILPSPTSRQGSTLKDHVIRALLEYKKKWKLNPTAASSAAVIVLNRNIDDFPNLLMIVRWYLSRGPQPPMLGPTDKSLAADSSLFAYLNREYASWST